MICPTCNTANDTDASFCKGCGTGFYTIKTKQDKSALYMAILLGWFCLNDLLWFVMQQLFIPHMMKNGLSSVMSIGKIYNMISAPMGFITLLIAVVFGVLAKNKAARIALFAFAGIRLITMLGTILIPLLFHTWRY